MNQGKRGYALENAIEYTNKAYKNKGWALINKVPTPWKIFYNRRTGQVYKAFPKEKSTVDFTGVSHGRSIAFEAKSTKQRTRFDLSNIKKHQIEYLYHHQEQGGISFFLIHFEKFHECYFVPNDQIIHWWQGQLNGGRKSIPKKWFELNCDLVKSEKGVPLHYLAYCHTTFK